MKTLQMNILDAILEHKRTELADAKTRTPLKKLRESCFYTRPCSSMREGLRVSKFGIIAEFKRKSPSKGWINEGAQCARTVLGYERAGAGAGSILTDSEFFGGRLADLAEARSRVAMPLLRKDFIIDSYQLHQARALGADAVLLIAAALGKNHCAELAHEARELGMEVLLELHAPSELGHAEAPVDMLGVNNRDLATFRVDLQTSINLAADMPEGPMKVSESGIESLADILALRAAGYGGFLVGERFMKTEDPARALADFQKQ